MREDGEVHDEREMEIPDPGVSAEETRKTQADQPEDFEGIFVAHGNGNSGA